MWEGTKPLVHTFVHAVSMQGDSGGPMTCYLDDKWLLAGISSPGDASCEDKPAVYTRVSMYNDWIDSKMLQNPPCFGEATLNNEII